jgi:hypothetical protein
VLPEGLSAVALVAGSSGRSCWRGTAGRSVASHEPGDLMFQPPRCPDKTKRWRYARMEKVTPNEFTRGMGRDRQLECRRAVAAEAQRGLLVSAS